MRSGSDHPPEDGPFPLLHAADVMPRPKEAQWLVEPLWSAEGVGLIGGVAKSLKTWVAAEIGIAVASGGKALGRFQAQLSGPVLVFTAEDPPDDMRPRFDGICAARGVQLQSIPLFHINIPELRLDDPTQLRRLRQTVESKRPRLLILDPFVRLVRNVDENSAGDVSAVLGALRTMQREYHVAVLLVHHMRKTPSARPAQQLRGSGDFAAWLDSGIYLTGRGQQLLLTVEHRRAPAPPSFFVRLEAEGPPHVVLLEPESAAPEPTSPVDPLRQAVLDRLRASKRPRSTTELRDDLRVRKASLLAALRAAERDGLVVHQRDGWVLSSRKEDR